MNRREFLVRTGGAAAALTLDGHLAAASGGPDTITLAATGDCILTRRVAALKDERFVRLVDVLRGADCAYGNCEMVLASLEGDGYPMFEGPALSVVSDPAIAKELAWMGFDIMGAANNHTWDYGAPGIVSTREHLARAGIVSAGTGMSLQEAAAPAYADTPAGRVALVNCASTFRSYAVAYPSRPDFKGIPGLNPVRVNYRFALDRAAFDAVGRVAQALTTLGPVGNPVGSSNPAAAVGADRVSLFGQTFVPGPATEVAADVLPEDLERMTRAVREARRNARVVIASIHAHEIDRTLDAPGRFLQPFARACIDAGADVFFGAGSHVTWGIELYKRRPICYGLGDFFFQYQTVRGYASDVYEGFGLDPQTPDPTQASDKIPLGGGANLWQTVVPVVTLGADGLRELVLHPVTLGMDEPRFERGTPRLAEGAEAEAIIARVARLSAPYGTAVQFRQGVGTVQAPA